MHRLFSAAPHRRHGRFAAQSRRRDCRGAASCAATAGPRGGPNDPGAAAARPRRRVRGRGHAGAGTQARRVGGRADPRLGRVPRRPRGQRLPQRARQPARVRRRRPVRLRVLRRPRPQHQRLRPARRLRRRQHRPRPARAVRVGTRVGSGPRDHARHAAALHALARRPAAFAAVLAGRIGRRDRGVALGIVVGRPGNVGGRRVGAGAGDPDATQLHARARVRGRPHRLPAAGAGGLRSDQHGDVHGSAAEVQPFRRRQRAVLPALAPDHLRARRRGAGASVRRALPAGRRLARLPPRARAAAQLHGHRPRGRRVFPRGAGRGQVQQSGRDALRPRGRAAARQGRRRREAGARDAREPRRRRTR